MPINASPVQITNALAALAATAMTTPVLLGDSGAGAFIRGVGAGSERTRQRKRITLAISRPGADGQIAVYGAFLPDPLSGAPQGNAFAGSPTLTAGFSTSAVTRTAAVINQNANATVNGGVALLDTTATTAGQPAAVAAGVPTHLHIVVLNGVLLRCSNSPAAGTATAPPENTFTVTAGVITLYAGATGAWAGATGIPAGSEVVEYYCAAPQQILAAGAHLFEHIAAEAQTCAFVTATVAQTTGVTTVVAAHTVD